jgi:phospholipase/carboxylesterase
LIHGWTGDENSMWVFTRGLSNEYWMIAPRAPHATGTIGYSWRSLKPEPAGNYQGNVFGRPTLEMLKPAAESLISLVDAYNSSVGIDSMQFDVMGFSQGAAMANVVGLLHPGRVRRMVVLAGFVPLGLEEVVNKRPLDGKSVFVAHGTRDELVPVDRARASIELLEKAGANVTYCEDEVGHKVSATCLRALESFLKD